MDTQCQGNKPTIAELEKILDGPREPIVMLPNGEIRAGKKHRFARLMHHLFWRTLCPRPDGKFNVILKSWPYNFTGRIAGYFHRQFCERCKQSIEKQREQAQLLRDRLKPQRKR